MIPFSCEDKTQNVLTLKSILRCFEVASGLKVNFYKSKLRGVGVSDNQLSIFVVVLDCSTMNLHIWGYQLVEIVEM